MLTEYHNEPMLPEITPSSKWVIFGVAACSIAGGLLSGYKLFF